LQSWFARAKGCTNNYKEMLSLTSLLKHDKEKVILRFLEGRQIKETIFINFFFLVKDAPIQDF
jgi:hypothetical protein